MQTDHKTDGGRRASVSRRNFVQITAAAFISPGSAAAEAGDRISSCDLPLTDQQQIDACIGQLRNLAASMMPCDPLLNAIGDFRAGCEDFSKNSPANDADGHYAEISYLPPLEKLENWTDPALSFQGAIAALELALAEARDFDCTKLLESMLVAAVRYFKDGEK